MPRIDPPTDRCLLVLGQRMTSASDGLQDALRRCHAERLRPRCLCTEGAPAMYVVQLGAILALKRMPGTASLHAPWCRSSHLVQPPLAGEPAVPAISIDPGTGRTQLRLAFSIDEAHPKWLAHGQAATAGPPQTSSRLSLHGLLMYLWERAELTRWHPSFEGRRNWAVVRARLLRAASDLWVGNVPLNSLLFLPEALRQRSWPSIRLRHKAWLQGLQQCPRRRHLLVAELKIASSGTIDNVLTMRHLPDMRFEMDRREFDRQLHRLRGMEGSCVGAAHDVVMAIVSAGVLNKTRIHLATQVCMDANWLPAGTGSHSSAR